MEDSLRSATDPRIQLNLLNALTKSFHFNNPQQAREYAYTGLDLTQEYPSKGLETVFHASLVDIHLIYGDPLSALKHAKAHAAIVDEMAGLGDFSMDRAIASQLLLGRVYAKMGYFQLAMESFQKAEAWSGKEILKYGDERSRHMIASLNCLGEWAFMLGEEQTALEYYTKALTYKRANKVPDNDLGSSILEQESLYYNLVELHAKLGNESLVAHYLKEQKSIAASLSQPYFKARLSMSKARFHRLRGEFENAIPVLRDALNFFDRLENNHLMAHAFYELGKTYLEKGEIEKSLKYFRLGLKKGESSISKVDELEGYRLLFEAYEKNEDLRNAVAFYHAYLRVQNEILLASAKEGGNPDKNKNFSYLQKGEAERIEKIEVRLEEEEAKIKNDLNYSLIGLAFLALCTLVAVGLYLLNKHNNVVLEQKNRTIEETMNKLQQTVAELESSRAELEKANLVQNKLMTIVAHDLRGQFGGMKQFAYLMKNDLQNFSNEDLQKFAGNLYASTEKINNLFENLIQWARTQLGDIEYKPQVLSVKQVIQENVDLQAGYAKEKNIGLHVKVSEGLHVSSDINMLNFILRNLISNALKFTPTGGWVIIMARKEQQQVFFQITDNGIGMPDDIKNKLFELGQNVSRQGTYSEKGIGIGLALCAEFARKMGAQLAVHSTVNEGTSFSFSLPMAQKETEAPLFPKNVNKSLV
ncbi:MAG: ATP-binding protein [Bacteroidota bacterium]